MRHQGGWARRLGGRAVVVWMALMGIAAPVWALDVGSDGTDGALDLTGSGTTTIDLSLAATQPWNVASPVAGAGVYDSTKWAVVFKYSSVSIGAGHTVRFLNHPSRGPVVWLVQGDVTINGTISIVGANGLNDGNFAKPGPGGFRGGKCAMGSESGSAGFGPGGGAYVYGAGSYATAGVGTSGSPLYGNARVLPLIGGSGGGRGYHNYGGGAGGGAILIAGGGVISIGGSITANGGTGGGGAGSNYSCGGAGGAIRLIAEEVTGNATGLQALGGGGGCTGGSGRIRVEANAISLANDSSPLLTRLVPLEGGVAVIWPPEDTPSVRIISVGGVPAPEDPRGLFSGPGDVLLIIAEDVVVELEALSVPTDGTWKVEVRTAPTVGAQSYLEANLIGGNLTLSTWSVTIPSLPVARCSALQARAYYDALP